MKIALAGGTGFIGQHLISYWLTQGHELILISRSSQQTISPKVSCLTWEQLKAAPEQLEGIDAIVNLAGESISQRWTEGAKKRILDSRLKTCANIAELVDKLNNKPSVVINASGMSIYGTSETETFTELSPPRIMDFLSSIVEKWEQAIDRIQAPRIVKVRVGLVLGTDGGALPKIALPFKLGAGGPVGSGKQWMSWIHIDDMVGLIDYCLNHDTVQGPVNATAPNPVTNAEFGRALGRALHRPYWIPAPSFAMKLVLGELSALLLEGQKVLPQALLQHGYRFRYNHIDDALRALYA